MKITDAREVQEKQKLIYSSQGVTISETVERDTQKTDKAAKENANGFSQTAATLKISQQSIDFWQRQMEAMRESKEEAEENAQDIAKIIEIARRISRGDKVPPSDEKKLMEYSLVMYQTAKSMAMLHEDEEHKKHKALFDEEEEDSIESRLRELNRADSSSGVDAVSAGSETSESEFTIT